MDGGSSIPQAPQASHSRLSCGCFSSRGHGGRQAIEVSPQRPPPLDGASAVVTFIGHSTFLIQTTSGNILTDPMYSQRAGPLNLLGPRRVRQPAVAFDELPPVSTVLLSHNHYDHCDLPTLRRLAQRFDPHRSDALR